MEFEWVRRSKPMNEALDQAERVAASSGPVLIRGASGTGKRALANFIHSRRGLAGPFVHVDCAAIPESLFESEFFGSAKGAYSDAVVDRPGLVDSAVGGTLYLHHVESFSPAVQSKLLRFLDRGEYRRVGETITRTAAVRIIASCGVDIDERVASGEFRRDLYFRINVFEIGLPPLTARLDDLEGLIEVFRREHSFALELPPASLLEAFTYPWPGNVRELKNWVERSAALGRWLSVSRVAVSEDPLPLRQALRLFRKRYIESVLRREGGNQTRAAKILGINRTHLLKILNTPSEKENV